MKVVITGGGTGGHVFPGLAVAQALKSSEVAYLGSSRGFEKKGAERANIPFYSINSRPLAGRRGFFQKVLALIYLAVGFFQSLSFFLRSRPKAVVATGGYVSAPVLLAAWVLRIPSLLLEQNLLPGRTTRFFSRFVSCVLVSFEESKKYLPGRRVEVTGNPVRPGIGKIGKEEACKRLKISSDLPVVLAMGASQGAQAINRCLVQSLPLIVEEEWQILHLTGEKHYELVLEESKKLLRPGKLVYKAFPFLDEMETVYGASDLVIARAGATTLAELLQAGKPSILVPYPYAADNHQEMNARWLEEKGGCLVILEKEFTPLLLCQILRDWLGHKEILKYKGEKARQAANPRALERILCFLGEVAGEKNIEK